MSYLPGHHAWHTHGDRWIVDETTGCWIWQRTISKQGYATGSFAREGGPHMVLVHRYLYEQRIGPIPAGFVLDHVCNVRHCVNPDHLRAVTQRSNVLRQATTKLTDADVRKAIAMNEAGMSWRKVAAELGVTHPPLLARVKRLREAQPDWLLPG